MRGFSERYPGGERKEGLAEPSDGVVAHNPAAWHFTRWEVFARSDPANDRPDCPDPGIRPPAPDRRRIMSPRWTITTGASCDEPRIDGRCFPAARARRVQRPSPLQRGQIGRAHV